MYIVGLIGAGIQSSRSPALHMQEAAALGLVCEYRLIDTDRDKRELQALITAAERDGFAGLNITHPFKQAVIPHLTKLSEEARAMGAVNTVVLRNGARIGHNTDAPGFRESFRMGLDGVALDRVVQLGAGGAGSATAHAILSLGLRKLVVFDPVRERLERLIAGLEERFSEGRAFAGTDLASEIQRADGLIHATPTGMATYPGLPLPAELLRPQLWVAEIVYFPLETELLRTARTLGCRTLDGGGMAVFQAAGAFHLFTGIVPDSKRMLRHFAEMKDR